ncbi:MULTISPECIES: amidohydrolase [unclassified Streptomyces]|uniref:amidohydrolase family protein n=1 Tax=unclassified Streptomyces TaxID=2593676 RepID=UPI0022582B6A|nr:MULTISPECIES: amidohydrolase family protein [unclassified Streptomyces]MCX5143945.1 amidohydrolase family protein [Streptomyces sp. NBC_00338]
MSAATGFVDAHVHVWDLAVRSQPWIVGPGLAPIRRNFCVEDLKPAAQAAEVTSAILVQTAATRKETSEFLALAGQHTLIGGVVGWVDLTAPDVADQVAELREGPHGRYLRSIRHPVQGEPDRRWLCRTDVHRGLKAVAAAGLAYDLLVTPEQLSAAAETARAIPHLRLVLNHLGKPSPAPGAAALWSQGLRALARNGNVSAKMSGLLTEIPQGSSWTDEVRPYVDMALNAFGPDRLMAGSDWPVCLLAADYGKTLETGRALIADLSAAERAKILAGTARSVYRLTP